MNRTSAIRLSLLLGGLTALTIGILPAFGTAASPSFHRPNAVAVDRQGTMYVAEMGPSRIVKLGPTGEVLTTWGAGIPHTPHFWAGGVGSMATDSKGNLWIEERTVRELSPTGKTLVRWSFPETHRPAALAIGPGDTLYFVFEPQLEAGPYTVERRSGAGKVLGRWTARGPLQSQTQSSQFTALAVDPHGNVHISFTGDDCSRSCQVITFVVDTFSSTGKAGRTFKFDPDYWGYGLAADASGNIYWSHVGASGNIIKVSSRGSIIGRWGTRGCGPLQFRNPGSGLALDGAGNLYVPDEDNNTVQRISPAGRSLAFFGSCPTTPTPVPPTASPTPAR